MSDSEEPYLTIEVEEPYLSLEVLSPAESEDPDDTLEESPAPASEDGEDGDVTDEALPPPAIEVPTTTVLPSPVGNGTSANFGGGNRYTIYPAPPTMREVDEENYKPRQVSIGPYNYGKTDLQLIQNHKRLYMVAFLQRYPGIDLTEQECYAAMREVEARARACYWGSTSHLSSKQFAKMLLLDAAFILEFLLRLKEAETMSYEDDPIFSIKWLCPIITRDLILLENQVPLFVLQLLFAMKYRRMRPPSFMDLCVFFYDHVLQVTKQIRPPLDSIKTAAKAAAVHIGGLQAADHLLHLCHLCFGIQTLELGRFRSDGLTLGGPRQYSALYLHLAGIRVEANKKARSFMEVVCKRRVIKIPPLCINALTISLIRNLIALEECSRRTTSYFSNYAMFLGCVVKVEEDLQMLSRKRIIQLELNNDEDVLLVFSRLCKGLGPGKDIGPDYSTAIPLHKYLGMNLLGLSVRLFLKDNAARIGASIISIFAIIFALDKVRI